MIKKNSTLHYSDRAEILWYKNVARQKKYKITKQTKNATHGQNLVVFTRKWHLYKWKRGGGIGIASDSRKQFNYIMEGVRVQISLFFFMFLFVCFFCLFFYYY